MKPRTHIISNYDYLQHKRRYRLLLLVHLFLAFLPYGAKGQESASLYVPIYTTDRNLSLRQNICDRAKKYDADVMDDLELRHALEGLPLNIAFVQSNLFWYQNDTINQEYPGLMAVLMDELARRGKFTWRDSFAVYGGPEDKSWTELLLFMTNYFDLAAEWWVETLPRLKLGMSFPQGWYDASFILVTATQEEGTHKKINLWGWLLPFDPWVWILIVLTSLWSGIVYMFLEYLAFPRQYTSRRATESFGNDIFLSFLLFTQHFQFIPKTPASRILATSMAFWSLLIGSAYTANLASFFVDVSNQNNEITTIEDAIRLGKPVCVQDTTAHAVWVQKNYPTAFYVKVKEEKDLYTSVNDGVCAVAVTTVTSFQDYSRMKETNAECRLHWTGGIFRSSMAGFATKSDAGIKCSSLIHDVVNLHVLEMEADGFLEKAWDDHFARNSNHFCDGSQKGNDQSQALSLYAMGGTFVVHFAVSFVAILLAVATKFWKVYNNRHAASMIQSVKKSTVQFESSDVLGPLPSELLDKSGNLYPGTTLLQDFWGETPSAKMRADSMFKRRRTEVSNGGLGNVQLLELLQDELRQQQEQAEQRMQGQLAAMVEETLGRQQDQLEQKMHDQITIVWEEKMQQQEQKMQQQHDQLQNQLASIMTLLKENQTRGYHGMPVVSQNGLPNPTEQQHQSSFPPGSTTVSATDSREAHNYLDVSKADQIHTARLRLKAHQIPQLLYPHNQQELRGVLAQHLGTAGIDIPEEANDISVRLRKL